MKPSRPFANSACFACSPVPLHFALPTWNLKLGTWNPLPVRKECLTSIPLPAILLPLPSVPVRKHLSELVRPCPRYSDIFRDKKNLFISFPPKAPVGICRFPSLSKRKSRQVKPGQGSPKTRQYSHVQPFTTKERLPESSQVKPVFEISFPNTPHAKIPKSVSIRGCNPSPNQKSQIKNQKWVT